MNLRRSAAGLLAALTIVLAGCSGSRPTLSEPRQHAAVTTTTGPTTTVPRDVSLVATAVPDEVNVYLVPDATTQPGHTLSNPNPNGAPLVFLVEEQKSDWYHVYLPV
ncbi:MAG TPA: hypothetical protein VFN21_00405, partial [Acidimicrobiales bacterium]|nr:hypothetical protein [Acidimicrobiales bacterium]